MGCGASISLLSNICSSNEGTLTMGCGVSVSLHFTNISFEMKQDSICPSYFINISFQMKGHRPWAVESLFLLHFIMCHGLRSLYFFTFQHFFRMKVNCPWAAESVFPIHFIHISLKMKDMCHGLRSLYFFTFQHFFFE